MSSRRIGRWVALVAAPLISVGFALPTLSAPAGASPVTHKASTALGGPVEKVIVVLRDTTGGAAARSAARLATVHAEQAGVVAQAHALGGRVLATTSILNTVTVEATRGAVAELAKNPSVEEVVPDSVIPGPTLPSLGDAGPSGAASSPKTIPSADCGTSGSPLLEPEALNAIHATPTDLGSIDGAGVTVATIADGVDTTNADFQRAAAFASPGSPAGSPVITEVDFSGDGDSAPTGGGEMFLDTSSIAAQGYEGTSATEYDLSKFVPPPNTPQTGCYIQVVGAAPGASVLALKAFSSFNDTTASGLLQSIDYAVKDGAKVINESFGSDNFPDTALDIIRQADDAAVAAGVTVVVSSGDAGLTSTIGSPASDPNVISVGASTTFQSYAQATYAGIDDPSEGSDTYVSDNISGLSSGGFNQSGSTLDLVAPGDLNWALCTANLSLYSECVNDYDPGQASPIELSGGTSESAPLTAAAAADVIEAYASTHGGTDPSPALVKQILMSTATDIDAPADQQGAGLLDVEAAVKDAESIKGTSGTPDGGLLVSPNQINVVQDPGAHTTTTVTLTNTGSSAVTAQLSTRQISQTPTAETTGSFCMQPGTASPSCPANSGTIKIWSGVTEVYQNETFTVPATTSPSRLEFRASWPNTGQSSVMHVSLFEPDGALAGYSLPQGLGDYSNVQVSDPPAGTWTAEFFTEQDGATSGGVGTSGTVDYQAATFEYASGGSVSPSSVVVPPGESVAVHATFASGKDSGDAAQSLVVTTSSATSTIPVTVRTLIPTGRNGGSFSGVLTGGNGRSGEQAQMNTYSFQVPAGLRDVEANIALSTDPSDLYIAQLIDPSGQNVGYSTNVTTDNFGEPLSTPYLTIYHVNPEPGTWRLVIDWEAPVSGSELYEAFSGTITFDQVEASSNLPSSPFAELPAGTPSTFTVHVTNTGSAPEAYFLDPREDAEATITLPDQNAYPGDGDLPLGAGYTFPYYFVPSETHQIAASVDGSVPVSFDMEYFPGDPDVTPALTGGPVSGGISGDVAHLTLTEPEVSPGLWLVNPSEIGPYPAGGAPEATASYSVKVTTQAFDPTVTSATGDAWTALNGMSNVFDPVYVPAGGSTDITVTVTPDAAPGTRVSGTIYLDDYAIGSEFGESLPDADELAAIPYSYKVESTAPGYSIAAADGAVYHFGAGHFYGSAVGMNLRAPIVGIAATPDHDGYLLAASDGGVFTFGDAKFRGSLANTTLAAPIVGIAEDASGYGYWLVDADGHVYPFGDATYYGSENWSSLGEKVVGIASTADGGGYWLATADGNVLAYGDAVDHGSPKSSGISLRSPIVGIAATPSGHGYWLVGGDGGVFAYGDAKYYGSMEGSHLNAQIVAIAANVRGTGYWLFGADGGVFNFGHSSYEGSLTGLGISASVSSGANGNS